MKTESTLNALMNLIDEPDELLYNSISNAIISFGQQALPFLKKKCLSSIDKFQRERLDYLIYLIEYQDVINKLKHWRNNRQNDLLEPYFIISKYRFPDVDWSYMGFSAMMIVEQAETELNMEMTPLQQIKTLNHIIYNVNKFKGEALSLNNPDYFFINYLLETHVGNPLSLGILYTIVAERLKLPVYGVDLPNHFILAYTKQTESFPRLEDVLFYINPYNNGVVLTRQDIRKYLKVINVKAELKHFEPMPNVLIIEKYLNTLVDTYSLSGKMVEADELREMCKAIE